LWHGCDGRRGSNEVPPGTGRFVEHIGDTINFDTTTSEFEGDLTVPLPGSPVFLLLCRLQSTFGAVAGDVGTSLRSAKFNTRILTGILA
jgi:hypothetical protein